MAIIQATFDGKAFVPTQPVNLPEGTTVRVMVPDSGTVTKRMTPEQEKEWQRVLQQIQSSEPYFQTPEEALRYTRKRP
jgi:predicted DNA-binding antitoxin AbrB/MazE fold protein